MIRGYQIHHTCRYVLTHYGLLTNKSPELHIIGKSLTNDMPWKSSSWHGTEQTLSDMP